MPPVSASIEDTKASEVPKATTCWDDDEVDMDDLEQLIASSTAMATAPPVPQAENPTQSLHSSNTSRGTVAWLQPMEIDLQEDEEVEERGTSREDELLAEYLASEEAEDVRILQTALSTISQTHDADEDVRNRY